LVRVRRPRSGDDFRHAGSGHLRPLIQQIIVDFQLTDTQASLLLGPAFAFVYVLGASPSRR